MRVHILLALTLAPACLPGQQDSVGNVRAFIEAETAPLDVKRSELRRLLSPDSGTTRADASFEKWKAGYTALVDSLGRHLQTPLIQFLIDPDGATGQNIRRNGGDLNAAAPAKARAVADSLRALLERHGVHGEDGEGDMYYSASAAALRKEAGPFLTKPLQEFFDLLVLEDRNRVGGDASLGVSWEELARRLAIVDGLVTDHPTLAFGSDLRRWFAVYLNALLGDWDNSSGFSNARPPVLLDEARVRLKRYAAQHPSTRGGRIAIDYLAVLKANNWRRTDAVNAFLREAMRRAEAP